MKKKFSNTIPVPRQGIKKLLLIMKLALAFVLMSVLQVSANVYSQSTVNLNVQDRSLREVLKTIEQSSSFRFFYSDDLVLMNKNVDVKADNEKVTDVLDNIFASSELTYKVFENNLIVIVPKTEALQELNVTGVVTDSKGDVLPGVNVVIEGTTMGVVTDLDGRYSIKVPSGSAVLVFSYIGFLTEKIEVANRKVVDVKLVEDIQNLQEVVVTALGIKREKKALGYAVTEVKGEAISTVSPISPVNALQGKVAGLNIAPSEGAAFAGAKIQVRGASTLRSNNMPIFVVDGIIVDNELSGGDEWGGTDWGNNLKNLNSDEFESVSVLKGAAATALYGSRALNGAIVITTKKGKARKDLGIKISQRFNVKQAYKGPAFQNVYGEGAPAGYDTDIPDKWNPSKYFHLNSSNEPMIDGSWAPLSFGPKMEGQKIRDYAGDWAAFDPQPDNFLDAYQTGFQNNTNISLEGGGENTVFLISFSNFKEKGNIPRNTFDRNAIFAKVNKKFNNFISSDVSVSYSNAVPKNPLQTLGQYFITGAWPRNYNTNYWKEHYKAAHGGVPQGDPYNDPGYETPGSDVWFGLYENNSKRTEESLRVTAKLNMNITSWFDIVLDGSLNNYYTTAETKQLGQGYRNAGGYYELFHDTKQQYDGKVWLNFHKKVSDFDLRASAVGEHWQSKYSYSGAWTNGGLIVPGQYSIENSKNQAGQSAYIGDQKKLESVYAFADVSWKDQVFLSVTGRNDWSSALVYADGHGSYSYFYPSISGSWLFSESFQLPDWYSYGKLRASWAHVGNDFTPYSINPGFSRSRTINSYNGDIPAFSFKDKIMPNLNLKPEDQKSIEFGFESRFFMNRLGIDFTYYKTNTFNQILNIPVPSESGVNEQRINAGDIQNQGIEIELKTIPVKINDFEWFLDATFARNRGKINSLYPGVTEYILDGSWNYGNTRIASVAKVGGAYGVLVSDSDPKRFKNTNDPNDPRNGKMLLTWNASQRGAYPERSFEERVVGDMNPDFTGSVTTGFNFKNFRIEAMFDFKIGGDISTYSGRYGAAYGLFESTLDYRDLEHGGKEWTANWTGEKYQDGYIPDGVFTEGTVVEMKDASGNIVKNNVGGMTFVEAYEKGLVDAVHGSWWHYKTNNWGLGVVNDNVLQENSYIGFRQLTISYAIPKSLCNKIRVSSADIAFIGRDLGFLYKTLKDDLNPFSVRSNRAGAALEWQQTPYIRTLGVALNLNF